MRRDDRRADVHVGVELAGEDARHRVGRGPDVERRAAHRRHVDELLEDARQDHGRPAVILASVLEELIDVSSVGGAAFDIGSATYSVTRILTGQLDSYVDIGPAIIAAHPWVCLL